MYRIVIYFDVTTFLVKLFFFYTVSVYHENDAALHL